MVRHGPWKLNYYHGFKAATIQPRRRSSRGRTISRGDPAFAGVRAELSDRVLDGWDPDYIRQRMRVLKSEQQILESWASNIDPPDSLRWDLRPRNGLPRT